MGSKGPAQKEEVVDLFSLSKEHIVISATDIHRPNKKAG
jgi:hypothetical protein